MALLRIIKWIWQLPQNLLGLVFCWIYTKDIKMTILDNDAWYYVTPSFKGGISLGETIIIKWYYVENPTAWRHEYGHTRQSLILGPLYLLVIGLPSLVHAWLYDPKKGNYFDFYTERWADKLGGIQR